MTTSDTVACPFCEAEIGVRAKKCRFCGEWVSRACERCGTPVRGEWAARGLCAECQARRDVPAPPPDPVYLANRKSRGVAAASALLLGGVGAHKFYLGNPLAGVVYILFCWTFIPALAGIYAGLRFALMDDREFHERYPG